MARERWPALSFETLKWTPSEDAPFSKRQRLKQTGTYKAAVAPNIADIRSIPVSADVSADAEEAAKAIARFDHKFGSTLAPFVALLLRSESAASSKIENLTASAKAVALAELGDPSQHNAGNHCLQHARNAGRYRAL